MITLFKSGNIIRSNNELVEILNQPIQILYGKSDLRFNAEQLRHWNNQRNQHESLGRTGWDEEVHHQHDEVDEEDEEEGSESEDK